MQLSKSQVGTSLMEILISLTLISISLLALAGMEVAVSRASQVSYFMNAAMHQLLGMADILQRSDLNNYQHLYTDWKKRNASILPNGNSIITGRYPNYTAKIVWGNQGSETCKSNTIAMNGCLQINLGE